MTPILFGSPISPFVRKVAIVLEEKKIVYEWRYTRPHEDNAEFREASPTGKIPAYRDDNGSLADSTVICMYLDKHHPSPTLYPTDKSSFIQTIAWEEFFDDGLIMPMRYIFFNEWMFPLFGRPVDENQKADGYKRLPGLLAHVEAKLTGKEFIINNHLTIADIALALGFWNLERTAFAFDAKSYPKYAAYVSNLRARPSFKKIEEAATLYCNQLEAKK